MKRIGRIHLSLACLGLLFCLSTARSSTLLDAENSVQDLARLLWDAGSPKVELNQEAFPAAGILQLKAMEPECQVVARLPATALLEEFITTHEALSAARCNVSIQLNRFQQRMAQAGTAGDLMLFKAEGVRDEGGRLAQNTQKLSAANTERTYAATRLDTAIVNALEYATLTGLSTYGLLFGNSTAVWLLPYSSAAYGPAARFLVTPYQRGGYLVGTVSD